MVDSSDSLNSISFFIHFSCPDTTLWLEAHHLEGAAAAQYYFYNPFLFNFLAMVLSGKISSVQQIGLLVALRLYRQPCILSTCGSEHFVARMVIVMGTHYAADLVTSAYQDLGRTTTR